MIPNLVQVDDKVWRGGRPQGPADYAWLLEHCKSILNLEGGDVAMQEYAAIRALPGVPALLLFSLPIWPGEVYVDSPPIALVDYALEWLRALPAPVYVHCQHGQDRTGLIIIAYRMSKGWTYDAAYGEALRIGYRHEINFGLNHLLGELKKRTV